MGLKTLLQNVTKTTIGTTLKDLNVTAVFRLATTHQEYDPVSDSVLTNYTEYSVSGIFYDQVDRNQKTGETTLKRMLTVPASEIPEVKNDDELSIGSNNYRIKKIMRDPADAQATLELVEV